MIYCKTRHWNWELRHVGKSVCKALPAYNLSRHETWSSGALLKTRATIETLNDDRAWKEDYMMAVGGIRSGLRRAK